MTKKQPTRRWQPKVTQLTGSLVKMVFSALAATLFLRFSNADRTCEGKEFIKKIVKKNGKYYGKLNSRTTVLGRSCEILQKIMDN